MKVQRVLLLSGAMIVLLVTLPLPAFAAEGGGGWGWLGTVGRWVNLAIVLGVLIVALRKPLSRFFAGRRQAIQDEIREAQAVREQAAAKLAEVREKTARLQTEIEEIRKEAAEQAERERLKLVRDAEADAERIVAAAERDIGNLKRSAEKALRDYAAQLSIELAEKQIRDTLAPGDEQRVVDRFFESLAAGRER